MKQLLSNKLQHIPSKDHLTPSSTSLALEAQSTVRQRRFLLHLALKLDTVTLSSYKTRNFSQGIEKDGE